MSAKDSRNHEKIQAELNAIEAQNGKRCDRKELHQREDRVKNEVDQVADPVLKSEFRRRLSVLRGES